MGVPAVDPKRDKLIRHFERKLAYFQRIPAHRRADEAADEGEATCRSMLAELRAPRNRDRDDASHEFTLDEWLDEIEKENGLGLTQFVRMSRSSPRRRQSRDHKARRCVRLRLSTTFNMKMRPIARRSGHL